MNAELQRVNQEIAALEERQVLLTAIVNRTPLEEAELSLIPGKFARLETRYNTLVIALGSTQSTSSMSGKIKEFDGIDINAEHLERKELLAKLTDLISHNRFVRLTSPAGSGKSSLAKLFKHSHKAVKLEWISCLSKRSCCEILLARGIDLENSKFEEKLEKESTVFFLDDAQEKYAEIEFWGLLIKSSPNWLPSNVRFVISSTHLLSGEASSPVEFNFIKKLERSDFLLDPKEANEFLELPFIGLPQKMKTESIKQIIIRDCGGLIGALRQSVECLRDRFTKVVQPSEKAVIAHFLSENLLQNMTRCFGTVLSDPIGDDFKSYLKKILINQKLIQNDFSNEQDNLTYSSLKKAGILVELSGSAFGFSSHLAKRYYFRKIFPKRSQNAPSSLSELIQNVISTMSSIVLENSTLPGDFPKEAVFQHLFMEGLALHTPPECSICPELSKIFPPNTNFHTEETISGEIDFYLNGSFRWGIELLVNGDRFGEHMSRFTPPDGKYVSLAVNDYAVVDIRRNLTGQPTNISTFPNRVSVFFKNDDYSVAHCIFGEDPTIVKISLAN